VSPIRHFYYKAVPSETGPPSVFFRPSVGPEMTLLQYGRSIARGRAGSKKNAQPMLRAPQSVPVTAVPKSMCSWHSSARCPPANRIPPQFL
jgi:hypothetical protein